MLINLRGQVRGFMWSWKKGRSAELVEKVYAGWRQGFFLPDAYFHF